MSKLSEYVEISSFNENTSLVQKGNTVYVKKRIPSELSYIYKILFDNRHKNISDIIEIFEYEDITVVIEEYINGETLSDILSEQGEQTEAYTKKLIGQVCDGLIFLHKHNIIHRDINPNNIMITKDRTVKIIDFDISRSTKKNAASDTVVLGTVGYAAPEQFGFTQSGTRTDLYAVGVLANVMLTGKMPNEKLYGGKLGRVIKKATAIDASTRYRNIVEFKHIFTNEVGEHTAPIVKVLRCVPGFRTWTVWKILIAIAVYAIIIPEGILFLKWSMVSAKNFFIMLAGEIFLFAVPLTLMTNLNNAREKICGSNALVKAVVYSLISFSIGACIIAPILEKVL